MKMSRTPHDGYATIPVMTERRQYSRHRKNPYPSGETPSHGLWQIMGSDRYGLQRCRLYSGRRPYLWEWR